MPDDDHTTIWVPRDLKAELDERKAHPNQPYHEVIRGALEDSEKQRYRVRADVDG